MKKYLIIGGAGFIGCNFADNLLKLGNVVYIFDNLSRNGTTENIKWLKKKYPLVRFVKGDITHNLKKLQICVNDCDIVYHLAAQVAVTTSINNPREDFMINALGTFNVLESIRLSKTKPILIYASTNKVYGGMKTITIKKINNKYVYKDFPLGITENTNLDFHSPYGCSKGCADQYVRDYSRIYNLKTVVMRQSCIYGPRQFGIEDQGWVAWFTIASMLNKKIKIFGDGKQVRDILYVDDLFNAWQLAEKKINISSGKIYNIGGGIKNSISLLDLLKILNTNNKTTPTFHPWRQGDQPVYVSDISMVKKELNWSPKINPGKGIEILISWVKENKVIIEKILFNKK